jgi:hypothetical protein
MAHEEGDVLVVAVLGELGKLGGAQEPGGQGEDAAELVLRGKAGQDRQSTTLGETTEQDALSGDTGVDLGLDEALEVFLAALDALGVLVVDEAVGRAIEELDVEPSLEFTAVVLKSAMLARREKTRECVGYRLTAEMGRWAALGRTNLTSSMRPFLLHCSTGMDHIMALSPRPWTMMTVAVCSAVASKMMGVVATILTDWFLCYG